MRLLTCLHTYFPPAAPSSARAKHDSTSTIGDIIYFIIFNYKLGSHVISSFFYIIKLGDFLIIIGLPWLRFYRIIINFK